MNESLHVILDTKSFAQRKQHFDMKVSIKIKQSAIKLRILRTLINLFYYEQTCLHQRLVILHSDSFASYNKWKITDPHWKFPVFTRTE